MSVDNLIQLHTRSNMDPNYVILDTLDNKKASNWQTSNYRTLEYTKNPNYRFPQYHKLYDLQNITEGLGPGMNPDLDSDLTHGNIVNLPNDRLSEHITFVRYADFLPVCQVPEFNQNAFLVSTSTSVDPQRRFNPEFNRYGVNTRNYNRFSDEHYRTIAGKTNKYRFRSVL